MKKYEIKCIKCHQVVPFQMKVDSKGEWYCEPCLNKKPSRLINNSIHLKADDPSNWLGEFLDRADGKEIIKPIIIKKVVDNSKSTNPLKAVYRVYVDYALHGKVGIFSNNPHFRLSLIPSEISEVIQDGKIKWQIEGESLAIKLGVYYFLKEVNQPQAKLIIYTDNKCLLKPFRSQTKAGKWWWEAQELASRRIKLEIRFICGVNNPADRLTRSKERKAQLAQRDKNYYYQQWLEKRK